MSCAFVLNGGKRLIAFTSLPTAKIHHVDVTGVINSAEIQAVVRPAGNKVPKRPWTQRKNPLVNKGVLYRLNPYAKVLRQQEKCKLFFFRL